VGLGPSLAAVLAAFVAILATVMAMAFRERRAGRTAEGAVAQAASDARVMTIIFAAIPGGMLLTLIVAWLVFAP
jgi:hypothetical protein